MGLLANYIMVDESTLDGMMKLDNEELMEKIEELEEGDAEVYDMDKLWDGLHFLLTGVSAGALIEGNPLSEAIVGVHVFNEDDEDVDFIGCIKTDELPEIISAMEKVCLEELKQNFDLQKFHQAEIYPNIWVDEEKDELWEELEAEFSSLLNFYKKAVSMKMHIITSIF